MIFIPMSGRSIPKIMFRKPIISINSGEKLSDADDDSDYDIVSNSDSEKISKGYERLCDDIETVIIHHYESDNDDEPNANDTNNNHNRDREKENLNNFSKLNNEKIILNLSHEKIFGNAKEFKINNLLCEPVQVKKSHSANFPTYPVASQADLKSPNLIRNLGNADANTFLSVSSVIYDVPRRRVSVPVLPLHQTQPPPSSSQCNLNRIEKIPINLNSSSTNSTASPSSSIQTVITQINTLPIPESPKLMTLKQVEYLLPTDHLIPSTSASSMLGHSSNKPISGISKFMEHQFKCTICHNPYSDPRVLDCLHSFCYHCLEEIESEHFALAVDGSEIEWNFNSKAENSSGSISGASTHDNGNSEYLDSRSSLANIRVFGRRHRLSSPKVSVRDRNSSTISFLNKPKSITCPECSTTTEIPASGINRLPTNFILARQTETALSKVGSDTFPIENCKLCATDTQAGYHCATCKIYLCEFCQDAHIRQNSTANHEIRPISDMKPVEKSSGSSKKRAIKCSIHRANDLKLFCMSCQQIACSDCTILIHRGHKCESISKAFKIYIKMIKNSLEKTRPLTDYANHTISKLNGLSNRINTKCDQVEKDVNAFLANYFEALQTHQNTLQNQIVRAKENKMDVIKTQKEDLVKRSQEAKVVIKFAEDLLFDGNEAEILTFFGLLQKRFDHCQKSKNTNFDFKVTESLQFLPEVRAPISARGHNKIPIFGIITTQTAVPKYCTLESKELMNLRVHRKAELVIVAKDNSDRPLCHGGLSIAAELRYNKDASGRLISLHITDKRDGTYLLGFTPDSSGLMKLAVFIQNKPIKDSPFTLCARSLRPHCGIYHCCTFCSSGGLKTVSCACGGVMHGYKGCGHGHEGHPGRRHWSCCANILENSECSKANVITFPTQ